MKILILGSNGLVGTSLTKILSNDKENFEIVSANRDVCDLLNFQNTKDYIDDVSPHLIINCAAKVGGIYANSTYRSQFLIENLKINVNLLESIIEKPEIKVINLGSSCIYPLEAENPIKEDSIMSGKLEPTNSPYAMAKLTAIELGNSLAKQYGHKILNLMPTNLYGPNDNFSEMDSHVIPGLICRMHNSKISNDASFSVWGTGTPKREFLFVDDLSNAIKFLIENGIDEGIYNIGSGSEISIRDLVIVLAKVINYGGKIEFDTKYPDGNPRKAIDSSKINNLGWKPDIDIKNGLNITYDWYINNL
jgi:GDP-L-fucose synthase|tara:strand:+ start:678 stop:1595 length:918 start_codon:yes stop_codon:yes gene_type:complete